MQSKIPSQTYVFSVLVSRFQSELELQKSRIWRISGFEAEYGGPAEGDRNRELEQKTLIEELTGLLVQAVALEAQNRQFANSSGRSPGRPRDVMIPDLAPKLLSVFERCHDRTGRQSVATSIDSTIKQLEGGDLFWFIDTIIQPLNQYLTTEFHRTPLSASRLARFALFDRRRMAQQLKRREAKPPINEAAAP